MRSKLPKNGLARSLHARFLVPGWRAGEQVLPQKRWLGPGILAAGMFTGLGALALHISNASRHVADNPNACLNCHWPNESGPLESAFEAAGGTRHAIMLTFHMEQETILGAMNHLPFIKSSGHAYTQP